MDNPKFKFLTAGTPSGTGDYFSCTLGISSAQLKPAQNIFKKDIEGGTPYLTQFALTTTIHGDFLCTHMAFLAMLVTALLVASGGAALAIIIAWTALAGGVGLTMGLMCGFFGAMFRTWMLPKTNVLIGKPIPQNPVLSNSYMQCSAFGGIVTYNPKVTKWWQALLVLISNTVLQVFSCIMIAAAAYTFATIAILATAGSGFWFIAKTILSNIAKNWLLSFTPVGGLVRIGATTNQIIQDQYVTPGDIPIEESVANGTQFYERGIISSTQALFTGQIKMEQALGLIAGATPVKYPQNPLYENTGTEPIQQNQQLPNDPIQLSPEQVQKLRNQANELQKIKVKKTHEQMVEEQRADSDRLGINTVEGAEARVEELQLKIEALEKELYDPNLSQEEIQALKDKTIDAQEKLRGLEREAQRAIYTDKEWNELQDYKQRAAVIQGELEYSKNFGNQLNPIKRARMERFLEEYLKQIEEIENNTKNRATPRPEVLSIINQMDNLKQQIAAIKNKLANPNLTETQKLQLANDINNLKAKRVGDILRIEEFKNAQEIAESYRQLGIQGGELYSSSASPLEEFTASPAKPSKISPAEQIADAEKYFTNHDNPYKNIKTLDAYKRLADHAIGKIEGFKGDIENMQREIADPMYAANPEVSETLQLEIYHYRIKIAEQITQLKLLSDALGDKINQSTQIPNPMADLLKVVKEKIEQYTPKD